MNEWLLHFQVICDPFIIVSQLKTCNFIKLAYSEVYYEQTIWIGWYLFVLYYSIWL